MMYYKRLYIYRKPASVTRRKRKSCFKRAVSWCPIHNGRSLGNEIEYNGGTCDINGLMTPQVKECKFTYQMRCVVLSLTNRHNEF